MTMFYAIRPIDEFMKGVFDNHQKSYPDMPSRLPSRDEIKKVIDQFGCPNSILSHLYIGPGTSFSGPDPVIYSTKYDDSVSILRCTWEPEEGPTMTFIGGYMDIVGPVVKELSRVCGPLVVLVELPGKIITPETDLNAISRRQI